MKKYFPKHEENRMKNEGNVKEARKYFNMKKNRVLLGLVKERYSWMNQYIKDSDEIVIELGSGAGFSRNFIKNKKLKLTDVLKNPWIDEYVDALDIKYPDHSIDVIICSHMLHHLANPAIFFDKVSCKMKKGGRIIIQDINTCVIMKLVLRITRHEGYSDLIHVFSRDEICNSKDDPWSANCSIPKLLFTDKKIFEENFPTFSIKKNERNECFLFLLSGGVIAKGPSLPLNDGGTEILKKLDRLCVKIAPGIFACGRSVVLEKKL